jgi:hypothetical protein
MKRPRHYYPTIIDDWYQLSTIAAQNSQTILTYTDFKNQTDGVHPPVHPICLLWMLIFFTRSYTNVAFEAVEIVGIIIKDLPVVPGQYPNLKMLIPQLAELSEGIRDRLLDVEYDTYDAVVVATCLQVYDNLTWGMWGLLSTERAAFLVAMLLSMYRITTGLLVGRPSLAYLQSGLLSAYAIERISDHYEQIQTE